MGTDDTPESTRDETDAGADSSVAGTTDQTQTGGPQAPGGVTGTTGRAQSDEEGPGYRTRSDDEEAGP